MVCSLKDINELILSDKTICNFKDNIQKQYQKQILIRDIRENSNPKVKNLIGTNNFENDKIIIDLNISFLSKGDDNVILYVFVHEVLHAVFDLQGYPITRNHKSFASDLTISKIGTSLCDSILHIRIHQIIKMNNICNIPQKMPSEKEALYKKLEQYKINFSKEEFDNLFSQIYANNNISASDARKYLEQLIEICNMQQKIYIITRT